jgi:hypothetical protein
MPRSGIRPYCDSFLVPGSDEKKVNKAPTLKADTIVLDLEDGVALNRKTAAREMVFAALEVSFPSWTIISIPSSPSSIRSKGNAHLVCFRILILKIPNDAFESII